VRPLALAVSGRGLVDPSEPVLLADDEGFTRGRATFETLRVYRGLPFRFDEHVERLRRSAALLGIEPPEHQLLAELARLALDRAATPDAVLRLYWTPGPPGGAPTAVVFVQPVPDYIEPMRERGIALASLTVPRRQEPWLLPGSKSVSYAVNMAVEAEAKRRGANDAVFVDESGVVLEGPTTNIWWRQSDTLFTPSLDLGILAGVTRAAVLDLAPSLDLSVEEGTYGLDALRGADEAFTSSSVREVMPVARVDDAELAVGPASLLLQQALRREAGGRG
jgi:4-amino-4-deoxychorismate lyase